MDNLSSIALINLHTFRSILMKIDHQCFFSFFSYGIYQILANIRPRRSPSSKSVCYLITCSYHVLVDRLQVANNMQTQAEAPKHKIGKSGYGRRRRSLQDVTQLVLQTGRQRQSTEAGQRVHRHKSTRTVA